MVGNVCKCTHQWCLLCVGVAGHDTRDLQFAEEHELRPVTKVISEERRDGETIINSYQVVCVCVCVCVRACVRACVRV